jgi:hypothetical protein
VRATSGRVGPLRSLEVETEDIDGIAKGPGLGEITGNELIYSRILNER